MRFVTDGLVSVNGIGQEYRANLIGVLDEQTRRLIRS